MLTSSSDQDRCGQSRLIIQTLHADLVLTDGKDNGDLYFDELLYVGVRQEVNSHGLDPVALSPFAVDISAATGGRTDLRIECSKVQLIGLSGGVHRLGDASAPGYLGGNLTVGSHVRFVGVKVSCNGPTTGTRYFDGRSLSHITDSIGLHAMGRCLSQHIHES